MKSLILDLILGDKGRKERREGARKGRRKNTAKGTQHYWDDGGDVNRRYMCTLHNGIVQCCECEDYTVVMQENLLILEVTCQVFREEMSVSTA